MDSNGEMKDKVTREKTKSKKKPLCRLGHLVQRKTRVGCLSTDSEDVNLSENTYTTEGRKMEHSCSDSNITPPEQGHRVGLWEGIHEAQGKCADELVRSLSPKEVSNSTKISLCCAMIESSKSVDHQHSNYHRTNSDERNKMILGLTTDEKSSMNSDLPKVKSPQSIPLESNPVQNEGCAQGDSGEREEPVNVNKENEIVQSSSPSVSDMSSCESSPVPTQSRLRGCALTQRRSADNLLLGLHQSPPMRHSSPDSNKSIPETQKRYKTRSISHDTMLPPRDKALVRVEERDTSKGLGSMDSLARHSLLAAQVFHLIPTVKARERNFLHGRIATDSLLGSLELEKTLPQRELRVFVGTWNMNGQAPPKELNDFMLPLGLEHVPDVIVVGTQESYSERFEWEVHIQETVGPSHLLFHSAVLGTLHLAVYLRRDLLWFCSVAEESSYSVRPGTAFRTKGAVAIAFMLFGTSFLFITAHLTAHVDKVKERIHDIRRIVKSLDLPKVLPIRHKNKDVTQNFDYVFWCGDLNFRLTQSREEVIQWVSKQQFPLVRPHMLCSDQLRASRAQGSVFRDFDEGPITFPPTYKYDPGTQNYDTSHKQRTPSYTDRILFKSGRGRRESHALGSSPTLECLVYTSVPSICTSDHKPVWGLYHCTVRPGIDTLPSTGRIIKRIAKKPLKIPLAAGLFNREVYLEGINRRAAALDKKQSASAACSLQ